MKILYIAKHDSGGNNDEAAIAHALGELGHPVIRISERKGHRVTGMDCDMVLFHKWRDASALSHMNMRKVFWWFDLVDHPDPTLKPRCAGRISWMNEIMPLVDIGFCSDGDWAVRHPHKLVRLCQGADSRIMGIVERPKVGPAILFTGISKGGGHARISFVETIHSWYGAEFQHISRGVHGTDLAQTIAAAKIVVAPDAPVTDLYWSNRVYLMLGFGAFLLHPRCETLTHHYTDGKDLVYYDSVKDLRKKIDYYLGHQDEAAVIAANGFATTKARHTYIHRCERLIQVVKERLP